MNDLAAIEKRLQIKGSLRCISGLRIGAAGDSSGLGSDLPVVRDAQHRPFIPGSSFKGILRSTIESLVRAVMMIPTCWIAAKPPTGLWSCNPLLDPNFDPKKTAAKDPRDTNEACMSRRWKHVLLMDETNQDKRNAEELSIHAVLQHSCSVCQLFGNTEIAGRMLIADMEQLQNDELPITIVENRDGVAIDRDMMTAADGAKYDYEVVAAGSRFNLEIIVDNPKPLLSGLLVSGLQALKEGYARLGGFGSRGLGRIQLEIEPVNTRDAKQILTGKQGSFVAWDDFEKEALSELEKHLNGTNGKEPNYA